MNLEKMGKMILRIVHRWKEIALSGIMGLVITRGIYNHFDFWQYSTTEKLLYVSGLTVFFSAVIFLCLFFLIRSTTGKLSKKQRFFWVLFSLLGASVLILSTPLDIPIPGKERVLELSINDEKNARSTGNTVSIMEIRDVSGNLVPFEELTLDGDWQEEKGMLVSHQTGAHLTYIFDEGHQAEIQILFNSRPDAGQVVIRMDGRENFVDLYDSTSSKTLHFVPVSINLLPAVGVYTVDILSVSLLWFVISMLMLRGFWHFPRMIMRILILTGALSLTALAINRCVPMYTFADLPSTAVPRSLLPLTIFVNLGLAWLLYKNPDILSPLWIRIPLLIGLLGAFFLLTDWNTFQIAPDSYSYVRKNADMRPPVYPLFVRALTSGTDFDHSVAGLVEHEAITDQAHPLVRVAQGQKVCLFLAALVLAYVLMAWLGNPFAPLVSVFMLILYDYGFFPLEIDYILSETIAQVFLFLLLSAFIGFLWRPQKGFLFAGAVWFGLLYLTRGAGIFAGILFFALILWAFILDRKKYLLPVIFSIVCVAVLAALPLLSRFIQYGTTIPLQYSSTRIPFALEIATPEDVSSMPDDESAEFLSMALDVKAVLDQKIREKYPDNEFMQHGNRLISNQYDVVQTVIGEITSDTIHQEEVQMTVSRIILDDHPAEYFRLVWKSVRMCTEFLSRLVIKAFPVTGFWIIIGGGLLLSLFLRGKAGYCAAALMLTHVFHLLIVSLFGVPAMRYVYATEFLVLLGYFILLSAILKRYILQKTELSLL